jgi:hypothetical protein
VDSDGNASHDDDEAHDGAHAQDHLDEQGLFVSEDDLAKEGIDVSQEHACLEHLVQWQRGLCPANCDLCAQLRDSGAAGGPDSTAQMCSIGTRSPNTSLASIVANILA